MSADKPVAGTPAAEGMADEGTRCATCGNLMSHWAHYASVALHDFHPFARPEPAPAAKPERLRVPRTVPIEQPAPAAKPGAERCACDCPQHGAGCACPCVEHDDPRPAAQASGDREKGEVKK